MNKTAKTPKTAKANKPTKATAALIERANAELEAETKAAAEGKRTPAKESDSTIPLTDRMPKSPKSPKTPKAAKAPKADKYDDGEASDRLPTTLAELKEGKGGLVSYLYLTGMDRDAIVAKVREAFKVTEAQAFKIARRHIGRTRLYVRILEVLVKDRPAFR